MNANDDRHATDTAAFRRPEVLDDPRVMEAAKEDQAQLEAGRQPDRRELLRRYPDLADALAQCLDGLDLLHRGTARPATAPSEEALDANPLGDFKIVREIGRGGMGVVYEAIQLSLGRRVALKVLPFAVTLDAKNLQRFQNEARAAALLHHTNIVPVYAVGCERGVHYYAMQLIEGQTLAELIRQLQDKAQAVRSQRSGVSAQDLAGVIEDESLELSRDSTPSPFADSLATQRSTRRGDFFCSAARLIKQAADGLEHAHQYGIVHRDIKPANLLADAQGRLWITDFGLAQFHADASLTKTGDVLGTLRYMSPEQASGQRVILDHRTDVYSLGATLYELATTQPIFIGQNQQELLRQILHDEPRAPRAVEPAIPIELETIILKAVSKNPADRYASAKEMADDLQRFLDDKPIHAKRPGAIERVRKWSRRHPSVVAATLVVLFFGAVGFAASTVVVARSLERETKRAEEAEQRFKLARRSADQMIELAEVEMADNPALMNLRRQVLESALAYYQELIELRQGDPDAQADLTGTRDHVKRILNDLAVIQGAGHLYLLKNHDVLDDLKLHGDERSQLVQRVQALEKQHQESSRAFHRLAGDERQKHFVEMARANESAIAELLTEIQIVRLRQIALQCQGPGAFHDSRVIAALKLTVDQRKQIRGFEGSLYLEKRELDRSPGAPKGFSWKAFEERRANLMKQITDVLTIEQARQWREMTGEPFLSRTPIFLHSSPGPSPGFGPPPPKDAVLPAPKTRGP